MSVVTYGTFCWGERRLVAGDAVVHLEGTYLGHLGHAGDVTVTRCAFHAGLDVGGVREARMVGQAVDAQPLDWLLVYPSLAHLFDLGDAPADDHVAAHALLQVGQPGGHARGRGAVTEGALDPDRANVGL